MVPAQRLFQDKDREPRKHHKRDDFLNGFELGRRIDLMANPIGWHGEAIFQKGNAPTCQNNQFNVSVRS